MRIVSSSKMINITLRADLINVWCIINTKTVIRSGVPPKICIWINVRSIHSTFLNIWVWNFKDLSLTYLPIVVISSCRIGFYLWFGFSWLSFVYWNTSSNLSTLCVNKCSFFISSNIVRWVYVWKGFWVNCWPY